MSSHRYSIRSSPSRPKRFTFGGVCTFIILIVALGGAGWLLFQKTVHGRLTSAVNEKLQVYLQPLGLSSRIGNANFVDGEGLSLDNLELSLGSEEQVATVPGTEFSVARLQVHSHSTLTDLVAGNLKPHAIELNRAKLRIVRSASGQFDFSALLDELANLPRPASQKLSPILLRDSEIQFVDLGNEIPTIKMTDVNFVVAPKRHLDRDLIHIQGAFRTPAISKIEISVFVDPKDRTWNAQLTANRAMLSQGIVDALPRQFAASLSNLENLSGSLSFAANASGDDRLDRLPTFELNGAINEFSVDNIRLPVPLRHCSASFLINNDGIVVQNATGKLDAGSSFSLSYIQSGLLQRDAWRCAGNVDQFLLNSRSRLARWLPEFCEKFFRDFSPVGTSDIEFDFSHDGNQLSKTMIGTLTDMSFSFVKMPFLVEHCTGQVKLVDEHCDFVVRSQIDNQPVGLDGFADNIGLKSGPVYRVNLNVLGSVRINEKLLLAADAQPKLSQVVRAFNPTGRVGGKGVIERPVAGGPVRKRFDLQLSNCTVRHQYFDYPIYNVRGEVSVENSRYEFKNLLGNNSSGLVACQGTWNSVEGLNLDFDCREIPLNDQLRLALKPEIRAIWDGFRPRGTLDHLDVKMTLPIGKKHIELDVQAILPEPVDADANYVSIFPIWFPYHIHHLTGKVNVGHGRISLSNMSGNHNSTTLACHGQGQYSDVAWSLRLQDLFVNSLRVDADLLAAVPKSMASPLAQLRFTGMANVNGEITLAGTKLNNDFSPRLNPPGKSQDVARQGVQLVNFSSPEPDVKPTKSSMAWDVRVNMNQADMLVGLPLKNVFGGVRLTGIYDGENVDCDGQLDLDSMTLYDNQITNVTGPFRIENHRVSAGIFVNPSPQEPSSISPIQPSGLSIPSTSISGIVHKGVIRFDAQMNTSDNNEFYLQTTIADGCLSTACEELAPDLENVTGHSFAAFRLQGDNSGTHSHRGDGSIQLRDAKIYELPVFISLLKILNVRQLTRTAFDSGDIDFKILGDRIVFERMEFIGDAISLIGNGEMNLDWDIDLNFYSVMGRNRINIPLISELYRAGSQRTLAIKIDGKLDNPRTHRQVLPELNDNLKRLFNGREQSVANQFRSPARPSTTNQPISLGESFFQQSGRQPSQFPSRIRR